MLQLHDSRLGRHTEVLRDEDGTRVQLYPGQEAVAELRARPLGKCFQQQTGAKTRSFLTEFQGQFFSQKLFIFA